MKIILIVLTAIFGLQHAMADEQTETVAGATALLEGAAWVTTDLDASVNFYTKYLGFKQLKRVKFSSDAVLDTYGVTGPRELEYVALLPAAWSKGKANISGLNFVQIDDAEESKLTQNADRAPVVSEVVMAYLVTNLMEIEPAMRADGVPFITGLTPSSTGKSTTLTVLDPNGVRIQMYQYNK